jgi:hypothetical protein
LGSGPLRLPDWAFLVGALHNLEVQDRTIVTLLFGDS